MAISNATLSRVLNRRKWEATPPVNLHKAAQTSASPAERDA